MARNTTTTAASDGMLPQSVVLASAVLAAVEDRFTLRNHPVLTDVREISPNTFPKGSPTSGVIRIPVRKPRPLMASTDEATAIAAETTIDLDYVSMGFGDYDLTYGITDTLRRHDATGEYDLDTVAASCVESMEFTFTDAVCVLADSLSVEVGSSGTPATWDMVREAAQQNIMRGKARASDIQVAILHPSQWALITDDLGSATGARAERRDLDMAQELRPSGYQGRYDNVDVYTCDRVPLDTADYSGMVIAPGCLGYMEVELAPLAPEDQARVKIDAGVFRVESIRQGASKAYTLTAIYTFGVGILEAKLGCRVLSTGKAILA